MPNLLQGNGPKDFVELVMELGSQMLIAGGKAECREDAYAVLQETITSGKALDKLAEFIKAQGGDEKAVYDTSLLPKAPIVREIKSDKCGYIHKIQCDEVGICSLILGGGRETKESEIDLSVGFVLTKKIGDYVEIGDTIAVMHARDEAKAAVAEARFKAAYTFKAESIEKPAMIKMIIS